MLQLIQKLMTENNAQKLNQVLNTQKFEVGQTHLKEQLFAALQSNNKSCCFAFIGEEGLGKTTICKSALLNALFAINRISDINFFKTEINCFSRQQDINAMLATNTGGVIFFSNLHTVEDLIFINNIANNKVYTNTAFVVSLNNSFATYLYSNNIPAIRGFHKIEFKPYSNLEMANILRDNIIGCSVIQINVQDIKPFENLVAQLKDRCRQSNIPFEYVSTLNFFFYKCFIKASLYLYSTSLDNKLIALSLNNFERYSNR